MADRSNHYERAFEKYLQSLRVGWIAVDEAQRCLAGSWSIKNLDFVVNVSVGRFLLVDVKGRRLPGGQRRLESWATRDDVLGMQRWQSFFGGDSRAVLVFVYELGRPARMAEFRDSFSVSGRHYGCLGVSVADYRAAMRVRSTRWGTVELAPPVFARCARPFSDWLDAGDPSATPPTGPESLQDEPVAELLL